MKCDIQGCNEKSMWIVDDNGVDAYLCPVHFDEFKLIEKRVHEQRIKAGIQ